MKIEFKSMIQNENIIHDSKKKLNLKINGFNSQSKQHLY